MRFWTILRERLPALMASGILLVGCAGQMGYKRSEAWEPLTVQWKLRVEMTPSDEPAAAAGERAFDLHAEILLNHVSANDSATVDSVAVMYPPRLEPEILRWHGSPATYSRNRIIERVVLREPWPETIASRVFFTLYELGKTPVSGARDYPISR